MQRQVVMGGRCSIFSVGAAPTRCRGAAGIEVPALAAPLYVEVDDFGCTDVRALSRGVIPHERTPLPSPPIYAQPSSAHALWVAGERASHTLWVSCDDGLSLAPHGRANTRKGM